MSREKLVKLIKYLFSKYQHIGTWWPGESRVEIMISAVLTQLSKREQVKKVLNNLKKKYDILKVKFYDCKINLDRHFEKNIAKFLFENLREEDLAGVGFYKRKYFTIKNLLKRFLEIDLSLHTIDLRKQLLGIKGIGKETADAILCYSLDKEILVIDEYTYRVIFKNIVIDYGRMGKDNKEGIKEYYKNFKKQWQYDELRNQIEDVLKRIGKFDIYHLKNLHGAFVEEGKNLYLNFAKENE